MTQRESLDLQRYGDSSMPCSNSTNNTTKKGKMNQQIEKLLDDMENSGESSGVMIADHIRTVASNGRSYGTPAAVLDECEGIKGWISWLEHRIKVRKR